MRQAVFAEWIFDDFQRDEVLLEAAFAQEIRAYLHDAAHRIGCISELRFALLEEELRYRSGVLQRSVHADDWGWCALLVVAELPDMFAEHARRGIRPEISRATAADLPRWISDHLTHQTSRPGLPLSWFRNHLKYGLLELGRLQFLPCSFSGAVRVYARGDATAEPVAMSVTGMACTPRGWAGDDVDGFTTAFSESSTQVTGNIADPASGGFLCQPFTLELTDWQLSLAPGDAVLDVHVPSGAPLSRDECEKSFAAAAEVFGKSHPDHAWRAFTCTSWLLDRELSHCLPPTAGILHFGDCFRPFPPKTTNFDELRERVFANAVDLQTHPARTSLQKAIQARQLNGGTFRTTSGYRLREPEPL